MSFPAEDHGSEVDPTTGKATGSIDQQGRDKIAQIRGLGDEVRKLDADPAFTKGEAEHTQIGGHAATCFTYTSDTPVEDGPSKMAVTIKHRGQRYCFDDASQLPLLQEVDRTFKPAQIDGETISKMTLSFTWYENTPENQALLKPATDGLREVGLKEFNKLTIETGK